MAIGKLESGRAVIEDARSPSGNGMAGCTLRRGGRKSSRDMVGYVPTHRRGPLEIRLVAAIAIRGFEKVVVAHMAGGAGRRCRRHMRSGQSKPSLAVIETYGCPTHCIVAHRTVRCRKLRTRRRVHRIIRLVPGR
jgi:hypothetical protein